MIITAPEHRTFYLNPGETLSVVADSVSAGTIWRLGDSAGSAPQSPTSVAASETKTVGPFPTITRFDVIPSAGFLTVTQGLSAVGTNIQAYDLDLQEIADASASDDDVIQRKSGVWTNRTPAQLSTDLISSGPDNALVTGEDDKLYVPPGASAFVYIAYASDDQGADFTLTFDPDLNFIAVLPTDTEIEAPQASDFAGLWKNYKGADGGGSAAGAVRLIGPWTIYGVQQQTIVFTADGGDCAYIFNGEETTAIAFDAVADDYTAAFEALPSVGAGNMPFSGNPGALDCVIDDSIIPTLITTGTNNLTLGDGHLTAAATNAGGVLYQVNDALTVAGGNGDATLNVDSVDPGGIITGVSITAPGTGYTTANGVASSGSVTGTGATFDITAANTPAAVDIFITNADIEKVLIGPNFTGFQPGDWWMDVVIDRIEAFQDSSARLGYYDSMGDEFLDPIEVYQHLDDATTQTNWGGAANNAGQEQASSAMIVDAPLPYTGSLPRKCLHATSIYAGIQAAGGSGNTTGIVEIYLTVATPTSP
jgi:hypothetical protein